MNMLTKLGSKDFVDKSMKETCIYITICFANTNRWHDFIVNEKVIWGVIVTLCNRTYKLHSSQVLLYKHLLL